MEGRSSRSAGRGTQVLPVNNPLRQCAVKSRGGGAATIRRIIYMKAIITLGVIEPAFLAGIAVVVCLLLVAFGPFLLGLVLIRERQVGIVIKRFSSRSLGPGQLIALDGEAGYQADTLAPGLHFKLWR